MRIVIIFVLLMLQSAYARNIVLLTSMPAKQTKFALKAERIFLKKTWDFTEEFRVLVHHEADQEVLFKYLNDPETHALFWVSHGGYIKLKTDTSIRPAARLLDHNFDNVARVFSKVHPHVKFIGIIGCNSEQILGGILKDREDLDYFVPKRKVIGQFALKRAIKHFRYTHYRKDNSLLPLPPEEAGLEIKVSRSTSSSAPEYKSLKVFVGGELLTVLPKMKANANAEFVLRLPKKAEYTKQDLKVVFDSGQDPLDGKDTIGELRLAHEGEEKWRLFAKPTGEPFGTNERIFIYKGKP